MAVWPESNPTPQYPLIVTPEWQTAIVDLGDAKEQRRTHWLFPKFNIIVNYGVVKQAEAETLWQFFMARRGAYESFYIYDLSLIVNMSFTQTTPLYVATADGTTNTYDLPGRSTSAQTTYLDGVADGSATYLVGGGDGGADRVTWASPPDAGAVISAKFTGYARYKVRFEQDTLNRDLFTTNLFRYGAISLKGDK